MQPKDFEHWLAKHGVLLAGARPEDYARSREVAWAAYRRGKKDQKRIDGSNAELSDSKEQATELRERIMELEEEVDTLRGDIHGM